MANLTTKQAAARMGISVGYLHILMCKHKIAYFKSAGGKLNFLDERDVEAWIRSKKYGSKKE